MKLPSLPRSKPQQLVEPDDAKQVIDLDDAPASWWDSNGKYIPAITEKGRKA